MKAQPTKKEEQQAEDPIRIGIYGGTFAPVHNGHVHAAKLFMEAVKKFATGEDNFYEL